MRERPILTAVAVALVSACVAAQARQGVRPRSGAAGRATPAAGDPASARLAILVAEDRRAPDARDLAIIRAGLRGKDTESHRLAVRALGRLERPELIPDIIPLLKSALPEVRAEAANAIGQAAQGWKQTAARRIPAVRATAGARAPAASVTVETAAAALIARASVEDDASVRAALYQTLGRLPYTTAAQVQRAETTLLDALARDQGAEGRVGVAQGFEALIRLHGKLSAPSADTIARLRELAGGVRVKPDTTGNGIGNGGGNGTGNGTRDARVRRLALETLAAVIGASPMDEDTIDAINRASRDPDVQVRRLAIRAAVASPATSRVSPAFAADVVKTGLSDPSPMVRIDALRAARGGQSGCAAAVAASGDSDPHVALAALDQLAPCGSSADAVSTLVAAVNDLSQAGSARGWHRGAHAIVALATASVDEAKAALPQFVGSRVWQLRMYAARAATVIKDQPALETLAADEDENVCEAGIEGLSRVAGRAGDAIYSRALGRHGYQAVRAAARALAAAPPTPGAAVAPLKAALQRLTAEGRDNSRDARIAVSDALQALGEPVEALKPVRQMAVTSELSAADLRRLASSRARVTIRGVGTFELALFPSQAPASVVRFARLAESGYYNGLTFHRVVPNFVIQGGSPGANEYVGDAAFMRDEVGLWPHVRGAVGISTRGRDTGDAQIFIDLVDNPRLDHDYTVFAQVLNGMDVVDAILEGDVIEKVEIVRDAR